MLSGYSAIPILPGVEGSWPLRQAEEGGWDKLDGWSRGPRTARPTDAIVARWSQWPDAGVGVCLGPSSCLVALDFDTRPDLWPLVEAIIEPSPVVKRGEKGFTAFYRFNGEITKTWKNPSGDGNIIELLSTGRQTVLPPSIHPVTRRTAGMATKLLDYSPKDLPTLPEGIVERINAALGIVETRASEACTTARTNRRST